MTVEDMEYPFVSIVIPTYNRGHHLRKTILSLFGQNYPTDRYEIIVVDNSSTDGTAELMESLRGEGECGFEYFAKEPRGPGPARNLGVEKVRGEVIAFIDSDCAADGNWLREGLKRLGGDVGIVQGRTMPDPDEPWGVFSRSVKIERESFIYECCNIFYRKDAFLSVGGFCDSYALSPDSHDKVKYLGGEDLDLALRVKREGWKSAFAPEALVYHEVTRQTAAGWLLETQHLIWPRIVKRFPELRRHFFLGYFMERRHFFCILALAGLALGTTVNPLFLFLGLPYLVECSLEPSTFWRGARRPLRVLACLPRDCANIALLVAGSIRSGSLLL